MPSKIPWHEDDAFWELTGPVMFTPQRFAEAVTEVNAIIRLLGIEPGDSVLDLGCGVGRHSLELARRGFRVTGVDRTVPYLTQARQKAEAEGLDIEFTHEDMRRFSRPGTFDAAINMFTSFSYFEDPDEDRRVLANLASSLKDGGRLVLHTHGKEVLARIFLPRSWEEHDGTHVLIERRATRNWGWMENHYTVFKDGRRHEFDVNHRLYSATELVALMTDCGFSHVDVHGDFDGSPYDHTARTMVTVARK